MSIKDYYKKTKAGIEAKKKAIEKYLDKKEKQKIVMQERKAAYLEKKAEKYKQLQTALEKQEKAKATIQKAKATKARVNPNVIVKAGKAIEGAANKTSKMASKIPQKKTSNNILGGMDFLGGNTNRGQSQILPSFSTQSSNNGLGIFGSNEFSPFPSAPAKKITKRRKRKTTKRKKRRKK